MGSVGLPRVCERGVGDGEPCDPLDERARLQRRVRRAWLVSRNSAQELWVWTNPRVNESQRPSANPGLYPFVAMER